MLNVYLLNISLQAIILVKIKKYFNQNYLKFKYRFINWIIQ